MPASYRQPVVGLALSGGGARGLAHIGVLKVLEREGIPINCLAGTSMGGLLAASYAAGWSAAELEAEAVRMASVRQLLSLIDRNLPRRGLLTGERVRAYIAEKLGEELTFADLRLPLAMNAVDLISRQEVILHDGSVVDAVRATTAVPGVFSPLEVNGYRLVDGGLINNVPVGLARELGAEIVIAVDISLESSGTAAAGSDSRDTLSIPVPHIARDVWRAEKIMLNALTGFSLRENTPEVMVLPVIPASVTTFTGFTHAEEIIKAGEKAANAMLPAIREAITPDTRFA